MKLVDKMNIKLSAFEWSQIAKDVSALQATASAPVSRIRPAASSHPSLQDIRSWEVMLTSTQLQIYNICLIFKKRSAMQLPILSC